MGKFVHGGALFVHTVECAVSRIVFWKFHHTQIEENGREEGEE